MKNIKTEITGIMDEVNAIADENLNGVENIDINNRVKGKLENLRPVLAFYGAYNAGKSTLLNALLGEELAVVGSSPTTREIHQYNWEEWTIFDTPGIDAPIEHENITEDHLKGCECVVFVISTDGDFESAMVYEKIAELTERKKKVFLVFNDKTGSMNYENSESQIKILNKVNTNLQRIWERNNINGSKPELFMVNAKSALKGRLEDKQMLVDASYIEVLEEKIESFMRKSGEKDVINSLVIDSLIPYIEHLKSKLNEKIDNPVMQDLEKTKGHLDLEKRKLNLETDKLLREELGELANKLSAVDTENTDLEALTQMRIAEITKNIENFLEGRMGKIFTEWEQGQVCFLKEYNMDFSDIKVEKSGQNSAVLEKVPVALRTINPAKVQSVTTDVGKNVLLQLRKMKVPGIKGRWSSTLGKWAGKGGKVAGFLLPVAIAGLETFVAYRKQQEYEKELEIRYRNQEIIFKRLKCDLHRTISEDIEKSVHDFFEPRMEVLDEKLQDFRKDEAQISEKLGLLESSAAQLSNLVSF